MDRNWTQALPRAPKPASVTDFREHSADAPPAPEADESSLLRDVSEPAQPELEVAPELAIPEVPLKPFPNVDVVVPEEEQANMKIAPFVVLSQARSGSTWLNSMLNSHPNILAFGEYLSSWAGKYVDGDGLVCKPEERLAKWDNVSNWKECTEWKYADKQRWVDAAKSGERVAAGFKWFNNHGGWDLDWARHQKSCPTDGCQVCKEPTPFMNWLHEKKVKIILLEREASLPHFISEMKQHTYDTYRCTDQECADHVAKQKVKVDIAQMHRWFNFTTDYWNSMKRFARSSSNERQFFTYDELCDRPHDIVNDLFRFLGLQPWRVNTSQTIKMGASVMRDSIENADEVAAVLKGTVFEGQVDEHFSSWRASAAK